MMMAPVAAAVDEEDEGNAVISRQEHQQINDDEPDVERGNLRTSDPTTTTSADHEDNVQPTITEAGNDNDMTPWVLPPGTDDDANWDAYSVDLADDDGNIDNNNNYAGVELANVDQGDEYEEASDDNDVAEENNEELEEGGDMDDDSFLRIFSQGSLDLIMEEDTDAAGEETLTWTQRLLRSLRWFTHVLLFPILVVSSIVLPVLIVISCFVLMVLAMLVLLSMYYCCHSRNGNQAAVPFHVLVRQLLEAVEDDGGNFNGDGTGLGGTKYSRQEIQNSLLRRELIYVEHEGYPQITRESNEWEVDDALQLASLDEPSREERMHQDMFPLEEAVRNTSDTHCNGEDKREREENDQRRDDDNSLLNSSQRSMAESGAGGKTSCRNSRHRNGTSRRKRRRDSNANSNTALKDEAAEHLKLRCSNIPVTFMTDPPRNRCKLWLKQRKYFFSEPLPPEKEPESRPPNTAPEQTDVSRVFAAHDAASLPLAFPPHIAAHMHTVHHGPPGTSFATNRLSSSSTSSFLSRIEDRPLYLFTSSDSSSDSGIASNGGDASSSSTSSSLSIAPSTNSRDQADGDSVYLEAEDKCHEAVGGDLNVPDRSVVAMDQARTSTVKRGPEQDDEQSTGANTDTSSTSDSVETGAMAQVPKTDSPAKPKHETGDDTKKADAAENSVQIGGDQKEPTQSKENVRDMENSLVEAAADLSSIDVVGENASVPCILQRIGLWSDDEESAENDDGDNLDFGRLEPGLHHDTEENEDDHAVAADAENANSPLQSVLLADEAVHGAQLASSVHNRTSTGGATTTDVNLPRFHPDIRGTSTYCNICLLEYQKGDIVVWSRRPNGCHHAFHEDCLLDWLKRKPTCPNCRQEYFNVEDKQTMPGGDAENSNDEENQQDSSEPNSVNGNVPAATRENSTSWRHRRFRFRRGRL